jgi:hypothetical protein
MSRIEFDRLLYQEQTSPEEDPRQHCRPKLGPPHLQSWHLASRRSKALGFDSERIISKLHEEPRDALYERGWATDKRFWVQLNLKADLGKKRFVDSSGTARPIIWLRAGERVDNTQVGVTSCHCIEFFTIHHVF